MNPLAWLFAKTAATGAGYAAGKIKVGPKPPSTRRVSFREVPLGHRFRDLNGRDYVKRSADTAEDVSGGINAGHRFPFNNPGEPVDLYVVG